jgi:hypothetical protein
VPVTLTLFICHNKYDANAVCLRIVQTATTM